MPDAVLEIMVNKGMFEYFRIITALPRKRKRWRYNTGYLFVQRGIITVHRNTHGLNKDRKNRNSESNKSEKKLIYI